MRFTSSRDYETIVKINRELINDVVDLTVIVYKLSTAHTKANSYGEAPKKTWLPGVLVPCLYRRDPQTATNDMMTVNTTQTVEFSFLREECKLREIYPEPGDIIEFDNRYYEIDNVNEVQAFAGRVEYAHSIVCGSHLTRNTGLQLEAPKV